MPVRLQRLQHKFVDFVPEKLEPGTLYISLEYNSANHLCACGCGREVVTIIGPADSAITYNGRGVSISTSIGNSSFACKSHYWIEDNRILWEARMTPQLTALSRARDRAAKAREYGKTANQAASETATATAAEASKPWWRRILGI